MPAGAEPAVPDQFPNEGAMSDNDRRRVQEGLARLGYYGAAIDGRFGPETRAAIRRFQHELGVAMTGTITGEQAARLFIRN
jgi:peptidoglycan hydrolase-like protein with peptidoglycan-binding domain